MLEVGGKNRERDVDGRQRSAVLLLGPADLPIAGAAAVDFAKRGLLQQERKFRDRLPPSLKEQRIKRRKKAALVAQSSDPL